MGQSLGLVSLRIQALQSLANLSVTHLEFYLSVKNLENVDEMKSLQNLHLYTHKSVCAKRLKPFGEIGAIVTHLAKIIKSYPRKSM